MFYTDEEISRKMTNDPSFYPPEPLSRQPAVYQHETESERWDKLGQVGSVLPSHNSWRVKSDYEKLLTPDLSSHINLKKLQRCFPAVNPDTVQNIFIAMGNSYDLSLGGLQSLYPSLYIPPRQGDDWVGVEDSKADAERDDASSDGGNYLGYGYDTLFENALGPCLDNVHMNQMHLANLPQIADQSVYYDGRTAAATHIKRRNTFFRSANEAFLARQSSEGKEMMRRARIEATQAQNEQLKMMFQEFKLKNTSLDSRRVVDFHGMRVKEGVGLLSFILRRMKQSDNSVTHLVVIVGQGNHSEGGKSRLKPAIIKFCQESQAYRCTTQGDGCLKIQIL